MRPTALGVLVLLAAAVANGQVLRIVKPSIPATGGGGGGGSVLARLNCDQGGAIGSGAGYPVCNANAEVNAADNGTEYVKALSTATGPQGQSTIQWTMDRRGTGEKYFGNRFAGLPSIPQGDKVYVRWMIRVTAPMQTGDFGIKQWILGDDEPHPDDQRIIHTLRQWSCSGTDNCYTFDTDRNIDGLGTGIILNSADAWHTVQVEIDTSTTTSSGDGSIKTWMDTNTYASPTTAVTGQSFQAGYAGTLGVGYFGNMTEGGTNVVYRYCCFEYATSADTSAFSTNWTAGGSFWARTLTPGDVWRVALRRVVPWQGTSRAERRIG